MGERVVELLYRAVQRLRLDALVCVAAYLHNAVLYAPELPFFDPAYAGQLRALVTLLMDKSGLSLAQASWAVEWGLVAGRDGEPFVWRGQAQVWSRDDGLAAYLGSRAYGRLADEAAHGLGYVLDREAFDARWRAEGAELTGEA